MYKFHNTDLISSLLINVSDDRHLPKRPDLIEKLKNSIKEIGLINPITVYRREDNNGYQLIAGRNRFEACKQLRWDNIPCLVMKGVDALIAEEIELTENLIRQELTAAQQSLHYARLMEISEIKNKFKSNKIKSEDGESVAHVGRHKNHRTNSSRAVAETTGRSATSIERDSRRVKSIPQIKDVVGTSLDSGTELDALCSLPEDVQRDLIQKALDGEKVSARLEIKKQERAAREKELGEKKLVMPKDKYSLIYCDPPWQFKTYSEKGMDRSPENHYPCTSMEDLVKIPVAEMADKNCVMFMWATAPMLPEALNLLKEWGFTYKSHMIWIKDKMALGYWFRSQHEILIIAVKGIIPAPAPGTQFSSVLAAKTQEHSVKPDEFYNIIESYFPTLKKIELFARRMREGWTAWGYEAPEQEEEEKVSVPAFLQQGSDEEDDDFPF